MTKKLTINYFLLPVLVVLMAACSKKDEPQPQKQEKPLPELPAVTVTASGEYMVTIPGDTLSRMGGGDGSFKSVYYSLEDGRIIPQEYANTDKWDIAFTSIYNSSIWANNGKAEYNPGKGGNGKGGIYLVVDKNVDEKYYDQKNKRPVQVPIAKELLDEAYGNVTNVSINDSQLLTDGYLTLDYFLGSGNGYAFYDFYGVMHPGEADKAHIVYNLPRPIIIKTAKGNYAKLMIYSFYKNQPEQPTLDSDAPYITFKYTILKDGSKDFTTIKTDN